MPESGGQIYINTVLYFLKKVPVAGEAVQLLQDTAFQPDIWDEIRQDLIESRIAELDYQQVKLKLISLGILVKDFLNQVKVSKDKPEQIGTAFENLRLKLLLKYRTFRTQDTSCFYFPFSFRL